MLAVLVFFIVLPLLSVFSKALATPKASLEVLLQKENVRMILSSLLLGVLVVIVSTLFAYPLAFLFSSTKFSRMKAFDIIFMIPFMTPPYIASMGWILFMQKRGLLQQMLPFTKGSENWFFTLAGLVLVMSLHVFPFLMTMLKNAMLSIPASLTEAAALSGASRSLRLRKILFPLLSGPYAIGALLVFVKTLSEYGTPATLGRRIGYDVFTTQIHRYATIAPIRFGASAALSSLLVVICLILWLQQNALTRSHSYDLTAARKQKQIVLSPGMNILSWTFVVLMLVLSIGIPYFSVTATSLIKLRGYGLAKGNFTFQHFIDLFQQNSKGYRALLTSVFLACTSASIDAVIGTIVAVLGKRTGRKLGRSVEAVSLLPEMLPNIVLVIGLMLFWNRWYKVLPIYNTIWIMVLSYSVLFLPYVVQYVQSALSQMGNHLEEAGAVCGGSRMYVFRRITLPMLKKSIASGWMMTFIIAFRELVCASLIAPPNTLVVSTFIMREFEQGSVSTGMAMALICTLFTTTALLLLNRWVAKGDDA